ncbi:PAS domain S-box-containing protein [bacterium JGI 053]|nr:PAS domain S-box-containing protein [bacterium JGI 053]
MPAPTPRQPQSTGRLRVLREPPDALRYGAAVAGAVAALGVSLLFREFVAQNVFIFFFVAIILAAWYGGRGPALLVTALALPLVNWFFLEPAGSWAASPATVVRLALFSAVSMLIGSMRESLAVARRLAEEAAREAEEHARMLEDQAAELQQQAAELEMQTEEAQALTEELQEAHRQLQESSARQLAEAQSIAHMGSWEWAVEEDRVAWSDEMYRVYGYRPGEVAVTLGTFLERVHPDDRAGIQAAVERTLATGEPFELDHRIVTGTGEVRTLHARGRAERPPGHPVRLLGTGQDVTAARAAEETERRLAAEQAARAAAEEGRRRWEAILEGIGESFAALDRDWRYTFLNGRALASLGRTAGELLGTSIWDAFPRLREDIVWRELHRVRDEQVPRRFEYYSERLGRWLAIRAAPWEDGISIFYEDVTDRRRAQEESARLAAIVESSQDAIFSKALDGTVLSWNAAAERLYGYTAAEIVGRSVALLAPPERADEIPAILRRLGEGEHVKSLETVRRRKDGVLLDVLISVSPLHDADGRVVGASTIARDISRRKHADAALRISEARYRRLIDTAEEGIWLLDSGGVTTYLNERMAAMLGRPPGEVLGRPFADFVHPDARADAAAILARRKEGSPERHDLRLVRGDGSGLWALVSLSPVPEEEGAWGGTLAMVTDVTERRRAEDSVRFLAEASRVLAQSLDRGTVLREIAQLAVPRLADYCVVALADGDAGEPLPIFAAHDDPAKLPVLRQVAERYARDPAPGGLIRSVLDTGQPALAEELTPEQVRASGADDEGVRLTLELAPRSVLAVPLRVDDRLGGLILLATAHSGRRYGPADLELAEELARRAATALENARLHGAEHEARRAAERAAEQNARLQAVTAAMSEARTPDEVADAALRQCMEALGAAAGWMGQLSPDGARIELLRATGFSAQVIEQFRSVPIETEIPLTDAVRTGTILAIESREELERRYPAIPDAGQRSGFGAWAVVPMAVEGRAVGSMVLNFADARAFDDETRGYLLAVGRQSALALERARLFEAERLARAEAEAANRAKFEFLTTMSHELRTPLNAIAGYVDLLDLEIRGPLTPLQRDDLGRIRRSQTHLLGLINDVLNFARIETGHVNFAFDDVPLDALLTEVETLISPQVGARGLDYEYRRFDPAATVRADPEKLRQIVLNLLSNSVKFTPPGGRVTLSCEAVDGVVRVHVADTGIGIPGDKLGTIFEPFVQVNTGYTRTSEGTGLGLSISRDLARAMDGELVVESEEGEGSTFTLTLPRGAR